MSFPLHHFSQAFLLLSSCGKLCMFTRCMSFEKNLNNKIVVLNKLIIKINCSLHVRQVYYVCFELFMMFQK